MQTHKQVVTAAAIAVGIGLTVTACQIPSTRSNGPAPTNAVTAPTGGAIASAPSATSVVPAPTVPVEVSGSGESVQTVNLERGGYTVEYTNSSGHLIVKPVERDGSQGIAIIIASETSGVTTYASTGPVTFQITNTTGPWTLRFVPLA